MIASEAIVIGVCFVILIIVLILNAIIPFNGEKHLKYLFIILLVVLPAMLINVYTVNCTVYGNCHTLARLFAVIAIISTLVYVTLFVIKFIKYKKSVDDKDYIS